MSESLVSAFAFITDIHGNHAALEAVLNDIEEFRARVAPVRFELICLGDSFDGGPEPLAVLQRLRTLNCVHLRGNHEDYLFDYLKHPEDEKFKRPLWKFIPWTARQLGEHLVSMRERCVERWSHELFSLHGVHANITTNNRVPDFFVSQSKLSPRFVPQYELTQPGALWFNGHSHYLGYHPHPSGREHWFNCGSVGYPFVEKIPENPDAPLATWVWVECRASAQGRAHCTIVNRRVPYSSDQLLRSYVSTGALEMCAPFSFAIAAQSLFNVDVVYPFFQRVKNHNYSPIEMSRVLVNELESQGVFARINALLQRAGLRSVESYP